MSLRFQKLSEYRFRFFAVLVVFSFFWFFRPVWPFLVKLRPLTEPASLAEKKIKEYNFLFQRKKQLILENEHLWQKYTSLLARCNQSQVKENGLNWLSGKYFLVQAKIILVRGGNLVVESSRDIPPSLNSGLVIFNNWLVGDWQLQTKSDLVSVNLWFYPRFPLRVKITDDKGLFISHGFLENKNGRVVLTKVLRGVDIRPGEIIYLLSAKYDHLPPIGLIDKLEKQDAVYQQWVVKLPWKSDIQVDKNLYLIGVK